MHYTIVIDPAKNRCSVVLLLAIGENADTDIDKINSIYFIFSVPEI
ncbi:hypothetical protein [Psychromonas hadalis]|nr:hypothetical protein [Psychromonas hadalis]